MQNAGEDNPLGYAKINFASPHGVYMHDTPGQSIFSKSFRAESSGCVRVQNVHQLVAWLLDDNGWSVQQVLRMKQSGDAASVCYGLLPRALLEEISNRFADAIDAQLARMIPRTE